MSLFISMLLAVILLNATSKDIIGDLFPEWQRAAFLIIGLTAAYIIAGGPFLGALGAAIIVACVVWVIDHLTEIEEVFAKIGE